MSDLMGIGASAVSAYRTALDAIGENVANAQTPGYARREVRLQEMTVSGNSGPIYTESASFGGVRAASVGRAWDMFRAADARAAAGSSGRADTRQYWLTAVEGALDDGAAGVGSTIGKFFNAATSLAASPADTLGRRAMLMALDDSSGAFRATADSLQRAAAGITSAAGTEVKALNADLNALAGLNVSLLRSAPGGTTRAALEDQRDNLIDSIAARVDVQVDVDDRGVATLRLAHATDTVLADLRGANQVVASTADDGRLSLKLAVGGALAPLPVADGSLAALTDVAASTADRRAGLDSLAKDFAAAVNAWSAQGKDSGGNPGAPLLEAPTGAASVRVLTQDPAAIAAASADGTSNGNLLALGSLRGAGGIESRWAAMVTDHAATLASAKSESTIAATRRDNSRAALDQVIGVNLDQEAADLMRYQQAYSGATRILQVARETVQAIINIF